jgi:hypothetical protein
VCGGNLLPQVDDQRELVCPTCGIVFPIPYALVIDRLDESRQLTSSGMVDDNLGSDQTKVIEELNKKGLLLSLKGIWKGNGHAVDSFLINYSEWLKDLGYSEERIELECLKVRRYITYKDRIRTRELQRLLRQKMVDLAL